MADRLAMSPLAMFAAAQALQGQSDELASELDRVVEQWNQLRAMWTGVASDSFDDSWDEWLDGANTVTAILQERSRLLRDAVRLMIEHEEAGRHAMESVADQRRSL